MKIYNRALDYTVLALNELKKGNHTVAAKLLATAVQQPDIDGAIATLEASNKHAFNLQAAAKKTEATNRLSASKGKKVEAEFPPGDEEEFESDPLDEVEEEPAVEEPVEEVEPATAMAAVLARMQRNSGR